MKQQITESISALWLIFAPFLILTSCTEKRINQQQIQVVAHRGDWKNAPENSIQGIENCIKMGVDMIEIDLARTKDSVLILMHDKTLERTSSGAGKVANFTYEEISTLYLKDHNGKITKHRIPTFEEALKVCKGKVEVFVDKGYPILKEAYNVLEKTKTIEQAHFLGFVSGKQFVIDYPELHQKVNYMPLVLTTDTVSTFLDSFNEIKTSYLLFSFKEEKPDYLSLVPEVARVDFAMATTQESYFCAGHTDSVSLTNKEAGWGWIIDQGFNAICTDEPEKLIVYLKEQGLHQ